MCPQVRDILSRSPTWDDGRGLSYTPCLLLKPALYLRLYAMQPQPCFLATSNVLALPRQLHFRSNADRAYNTLHFASKVVCQRDTLWKPCFAVMCTHIPRKTQKYAVSVCCNITVRLTAYFGAAFPVSSALYASIYHNNYAYCGLKIKRINVIISTEKTGRSQL